MRDNEERTHPCPTRIAAARSPSAPSPAVRRPNRAPAAHWRCARPCSPSRAKCRDGGSPPTRCRRTSRSTRPDATSSSIGWWTDFGPDAADVDRRRGALPRRCVVGQPHPSAGGRRAAAPGTVPARQHGARRHGHPRRDAARDAEDARQRIPSGPVSTRTSFTCSGRGSTAGSSSCSGSTGTRRR